MEMNFFVEKIIKILFSSKITTGTLLGISLQPIFRVLDDEVLMKAYQKRLHGTVIQLLQDESPVGKVRLVKVQLAKSR